MNLYKKIQDSLAQYGLYGCIVRATHFAGRQVGIIWENFYYLEKELSPQEIKIEFPSDKIIRELTFEDFRNGDTFFFTEAKLSIIKKQLADKSYIPYGIIINNKLAYSAWISLDKLPLPYGFELKLKKDEGALLDDYCMPEFRKQSLHSITLQYRLSQLYKHGKKQSVVVILKGNRPALKAETKAGFKTVKEFTLFKIFNRKKMIWK